jgi:hypothetical protein
MSDVSHAEIARQDWSRTLVVGGLGTLDIQEVNAHMNALLTTSKQRPKCVMFPRLSREVVFVYTLPIPYHARPCKSKLLVVITETVKIVQVEG